MLRSLCIRFAILFMEGSHMRDKEVMPTTMFSSLKFTEASLGEGPK